MIDGVVGSSVTEDEFMSKPLLTDELWSVIQPGLPRARPSPLGGRPRASDRACLSGILFVLKTGIPWEDLPAEFGCCGMTCWRRLRDWQKAGVWTGLHRVLLEMLHAADQIDWSRTLVDSATVRAVGGAKKPGRIPRIAASSAASIMSRATHRVRRWSRCWARPTARMANT
jgi:transposase